MKPTRINSAAARSMPFALSLVSLQALLWYADPTHGSLFKHLAPTEQAQDTNILWIGIGLVGIAYLAAFALCGARGDTLQRRSLPSLPIIALALHSLTGDPKLQTIAMFGALLVGIWPLPARREMLALTANAQRTSARLLSHAAASSEQENAEELARRRFRQDSWDVSKEAIGIRANIDQQLLLLSRALHDAQRAAELEASAPEISSKALIEHYRGVFAPAPTQVASLIKALETCSTRWHEALEAVRRISTRVFATHALYRLAQRSGIEVVSLIIGFLMAAGALQVAFRYQATAGINIAAYWTLDDLFVQAIAVALPTLLALMAAELLFRGLRLGVEGSDPARGGLVQWAVLSRVLQWTLLRPNAFAVVLILGILFLSSWWGHAIGTASFREFTRMTDGKSESATATDGTVLGDVLLVGTTSRTAVFLQKRRGAKWEDVATLPATSYRIVLACTAVTFLPLSRPAFCPDPEDSPLYRVVIMDRAHVICHAKADVCERLPRLPGRRSVVPPWPNVD